MGETKQSLKDAVARVADVRGGGACGAVTYVGHIWPAVCERDPHKGGKHIDRSQGIEFWGNSVDHAGKAVA